MVIAYLTESYKIRFQTNDFIHNGFISPGTTVPSCQMFHCNTVKRSYDRACTKANAIVTNRLNKNLFIVDSFKILIPAKIKTFCQIFTYDIQNIIVSLFLSNQILSNKYPVKNCEQPSRDIFYAGFPTESRKACQTIYRFSNCSTAAPPLFSDLLSLVISKSASSSYAPRVVCGWKSDEVT